MKTASVFCILMLVLCGASLNAASLDNIRFSTKKGQKQIIFDLSGAFQYSQFLLTRPFRAVVDLKKTRLNVALSKLSLPRKWIKSIRSSQNKQGLRIVLDLTKQFEAKASPLAPVGKFSHRLLLELKETGIDKAAVKPKRRAMAAIEMLPPTKLRDVVIVLDPGHGGKDPGAMGKRGTREKQVVLQIARRVKAYIDKQPGMKAVLTRTGDYYISLRKRLMIAREHDADIFVSIHADAFNNRNSHGASVFALSQRGATSEAARWLAEKENYSELGGVNLDELNDKSGLIRSVLIDLSQTATIGASLELGQQILGHLDKITSLHHSKVEQARFVVLKSPDIPSVLIETGFISNLREERNLRSAWYQKRLALAILGGLKRYFWLHPPMGTYVEAQAKAMIHVVKRGETISGLSARYRVSVKSLLKVNRLQSSRLKIGQKLKIPSSGAVA